MSNPRAMLDQNANAIVSKMVELALDGDLAAIRLCIERILPRTKPDMGIHLNLPEGNLDMGNNMLQVTNNITQAVIKGEMTVSEAETLTLFLRKQRRDFNEAVRQCEIDKIS